LRIRKASEKVVNKRSSYTSALHYFVFS